MNDRDLAFILEDLPAADGSAAAELRERARSVLRPRDAFRRLDEVAAWMAGWHRTPSPRVERPAAVVFVASHGVAAAGVSAYPAWVTAAMRDALQDGAATASVLARHVGALLQVVDVGTDEPTRDLGTEAALTYEQVERSFEAGRRAVAAFDPVPDLLVIGEMGIGNTTAAAAVCHALFGMTAEDWTGRGTGVDDDGLRRKIDVVRRACARPFARTPIEVLRQVGGAELVAMCGAAIEARLRSIPVVQDGFVVTASLAALEVARPGALEHVVAGHRSSEPGHRMLLEKLGMEPLLDLDLRLGEGSGALLTVPLIRLAVACATEVATFEERGL